MDQKLAATPQLSPDHYYWWSGDAWVPAATHPDGQAALAALASVPEQAASSEAVAVTTPSESGQPFVAVGLFQHPHDEVMWPTALASEPAPEPEPATEPKAEPAEWTRHPATAMTILPGLVPTTAPPALVSSEEMTTPTEAAPSALSRLLSKLRR